MFGKLIKQIKKEDVKNETPPIPLPIKISTQNTISKLE